MHDSKSLLDRTHVASPCPSDWGRMEGDEKKRFCAECRLHVYNVSAMSRAEAESVIARTEGRLCLRLYRRADGTVITRDCPVGLRAVRRRAARAAGAAFAAVLSLLTGASVAASPRASLSQGQAVTCRLKVKRLPSTTAESRPTLRGIVLDHNGAVIANANVTLVRKGEKGGRVKATNDEGNFRFESLEPGSYTVIVEAPGFTTFKEKDLEVKSGEDVSLEVTLPVGAVGEVITVYSCGDAAVETKAP